MFRVEQKQVVLDDGRLENSKTDTFPLMICLLIGSVRGGVECCITFRSYSAASRREKTERFNDLQSTYLPAQ